MTPYYQDDAVTIYHGDCREILPTLGQYDLLLTDPPYGRVKGFFDQEWTNRPAMLEDAQLWRDLIFSAMKANATLWWFAWPSLAGRIEALIGERLNLLSHVVWIKPSPLAQKHCPEALRAPGPETERIIMAEHYGADHNALGISGYSRKCAAARGFIFEPLRAYLEGERVRAGWTTRHIAEKFQIKTGSRTVTGMAGHWFDRIQWLLPTAENYEWLRRLFNSQGGSYLSREYEDLSREYEDLRRYFCLEKGDPKTDIWRFPPSLNKSGHPTEKPLSLILFMVRISCRPGGIVCDPFAGSGTTGVAAKALGRRAVLIEREERYCAIAVQRLAQEVLALPQK